MCRRTVWLEVYLLTSITRSLNQRSLRTLYIYPESPIIHEYKVKFIILIIDIWCQNQANGTVLN